MSCDTCRTTPVKVMCPDCGSTGKEIPRFHINWDSMRAWESVCDIDRKIDLLMVLYRPLASKLIDIKRRLDMRIADPCEYAVALKKGEWKDQYDAGITKIVGLDIAWV